MAKVDVNGTLYFYGDGTLADAPKCKHDIERGKCLDLECVDHSNIPVRGEKSWDSALQQPSGGTSQNQYLWQSLYQSALNHYLTGNWTYPSWLQHLPTAKASELPPEPEATVRMMPVIGYRGWMVSRSAPRNEDGRFASGPAEVALRSLNFGEWERRSVTRAKCAVTEKHKAPNYHCQCGLYVLSNLADAPNWYGHGREWTDGVIVGAVIGWGDVIQHDDEGWRAEYARPIGFLDTALFKDEPLVEAAAQQYGVPVLGRKSLQLLAKEYGEAFA